MSALMIHVVSVAVLALMVELACRVGKFRSAVCHALWLVVLVKLMVPPLPTTILALLLMMRSKERPVTLPALRLVRPEPSPEKTLAEMLPVMLTCPVMLMLPALVRAGA